MINNLCRVPDHVLDTEGIDDLAKFGILKPADYCGY